MGQVSVSARTDSSSEDDGEPAVSSLEPVVSLSEPVVLSDEAGAVTEATDASEFDPQHRVVSGSRSQTVLFRRLRRSIFYAKRVELSLLEAVARGQTLRADKWHRRVSKLGCPYAHSGRYLYGT